MRRRRFLFPVSDARTGIRASPAAGAAGAASPRSADRWRMASTNTPVQNYRFKGHTPDYIYRCEDTNESLNWLCSTPRDLHVTASAVWSTNIRFVKRSRSSPGDPDALRGERELHRGGPSHQDEKEFKFFFPLHKLILEKKYNRAACLEKFRDKCQRIMIDYLLLIWASQIHSAFILIII